MLKPSDSVLFIHGGSYKRAVVCRVIGQEVVIETGFEPVLGFFMTVPLSHVTKEAA
jgi:hypothetical protein